MIKTFQLALTGLVIVLLAAMLVVGSMVLAMMTARHAGALCLVVVLIMAWGLARDD